MACDENVNFHPHRHGDQTGVKYNLLLQQIEALKRELQAREDFIAIAAHELRNPMTPLLGISQLAVSVARKAKPPVPLPLLSLLERMQSAIQDFVDRATRLLDLSRINAGNLQLTPVPVDLSATLGAIAAKYETIAARRGCTLQLRASPGVTAVLDPLAFTQIVENLLANAFKFGAGKPVSMRLEQTNGTARLMIQDAGIGMTPEQQAHIFGRFEQVSAPPLGGGLGIGLWLTHRLVAAMNGRISVASKAGRGSTFTVHLPLA